MQELELIYLANPRGFCAGVKYAISYVETVQDNFSAQNIFVRKEIVHNRRVVEDMQKKGIHFVNELDEVPDQSLVIFSAHGVSPQVIDTARSKNLKIADATCPLVTRVHRKAKKFKDTHQIIYIGHKGHDEAIGTMGEAEMYLVESIEDVYALKNKIQKDRPLTYLMQTTLSVRDTKKIVEAIAEAFPDVEHPEKDDICYATTERQIAVEKMTLDVDAMMVIGSQNSSNSMRLYQLAHKIKSKSFIISSANEINRDFIVQKQIQSLGITAGASTPQILVEEIISKLKEFFPQAVVMDYPNSVEDKMNFKLPKDLLK